MKKTNLRAWMDRQPIGIAMIGAALASAVDVHEKFLSELRSGDMSALPVPDSDTWQGCYRSHKRVCRELTKALQSAAAQPPMSDGMAFDPARLDPQEQLARMEDAAQRMARGDQPCTAALPAKLGWMTPEVLFFMRIAVPCLMEHGVAPTIMLRRARHGDLAALDNLLRLDWSAIRDPGIATIVRRLRNSPSCPAFLRLTEAMAEGMRPTRTAKQLKVRMCAWLIQLADTKRCPLTSTQVRELFDALAKDSGMGQADPDLPASPEALAKAIQRERREQPVFGSR